MIDRRSFLRWTGSALAAVGLVRTLPVPPVVPKVSTPDIYPADGRTAWEFSGNLGPARYKSLPSDYVTLQDMHLVQNAWSHDDAEYWTSRLIIRGDRAAARTFLLQYDGFYWAEPDSIMLLDAGRASPVLATWGLPIRRPREHAHVCLASHRSSVGLLSHGTRAAITTTRLPADGPVQVDFGEANRSLGARRR